MDKSLALLLLLLLFIAHSMSLPLDSRGPCDISTRNRRNVAAPDVGGDSIANPLNETWKCKPEMGLSCTFTMPVTISVSDFWPNTRAISKARQRDLIMEAAKKWEEVTRDLSFAWAPEGVDGDIDVKFAFIDGVGGAVGRAGNPSPNTPTPTWVRLDDAEKWVTHDHANFDKGEFSLQWALLHEFGHAIGLRHSTNKEDIMYSELQVTKAILNAGDIIAAQAFYGDFIIPGPAVTPAATPVQVTPSPVQLHQNPRGGIIVDSLPDIATTSRPFKANKPDNNGQNAVVNGLIVDAELTTEASNVRMKPRRKKNKRRCTKKQQRNNNCRPKNKTSTNETSLKPNQNLTFKKKQKTNFRRI